eukprot:XP_003978664.1 PREDICTED: DNA damage-inducible transcript 4-like protein [Takifugu rubripes]
MVATSTLKSKSDCVWEPVDRQYYPACIERELDFWDHCLADPGRAADVAEDRSCQHLASMLESCLSRAKKTTLHCSSVLVPETLTRRIAREVLRLACGEPCGLRGCILFVHLEMDKGCRRLERIVCDGSVVPTFELTLVFKQDGGAWPSLRDLFLLGACFGPAFRHVLKLSPGFRLVKRKLYASSAGAVVEEC